MKKAVQNLLKYFAKTILAKYQPLIIGITGSVGKTSAKEAVFHVVSQKYPARKPEKNFNNEFGLPLTILGMESPGKNPLKWVQLLAGWLILRFGHLPYPKVLILEMGVDRPGDMDYLLSIAKPDIGIITAIGETHLEFFKTLEGIEEEKGKIAKQVAKDGWLILNADNDKAARQKAKTQSQTLSYGLRQKADVNIKNVREDFSALLTSYEVAMPSRSFKASSRVFGETHLAALACACAVAETLKIETDLIIRGLTQYKPAPGRQNFIAGIKKSSILDDSYNASPTATKSVLNLYEKIPASYKIIFLGDMLELGQLYESSHLEVGRLAATTGVDKLITVGPGGKLIAQGAAEAGLPGDKILEFANSTEALTLADELVQPNSLILVKGSQGMRMERIAKELMAEPMRAPELLCRQYGKWLEE